MATYDVTGPSTAGARPSRFSAGIRTPYLVENVIDIAAINSDAGTATGDVLQALDIPAETLIMQAGMEILTQLSNSVTLDLGITGGDVDKIVLEEAVKNIFTSEVVVLDKKDLNPALYKMLNTENLAVYLIFSLVALISMFNLVGSLTIMMVEKKKDLRVLKVLGGQEDDFNKIFFTLGVFTSVFGALLGIFIGWMIILTQNTYSLIVVPGTSIPYPVSLTSFNVIVVFLTIVFLGLLTSAWSTHSRSSS